MKKILCPTDFSEAAQSGVAYAAKLAASLGAELTLYHVKALFDFTPIELAVGKTVILEEIRRQLDELSFEVARTHRITCHGEVDSGLTGTTSAIAKKAVGYDLVVMGTNGADDLHQFFTGTNTYKTILKAETPVILVPESGLYSAIKTLVFAFDYLRNRKLPMEQLAALAELFDCEVIILQVMEEAYSETVDEELQELQFIFNTRYGDKFRYRFDTIRSSDIAGAINSYVSRNQPDALALCAVHRGLIERLFHTSTIKHITLATDYPVVVFHHDE